MEAIDQARVRQFIRDVELEDGYILTKLLPKKEEKTESGIIIPGNRGVHRADRAIVLKSTIGKVQPGYKVLFHRWAAVELEEAGEKLAIISLKDLIGIYARQPAATTKRNHESGLEAVSELNSSQE